MKENSRTIGTPSWSQNPRKRQDRVRFDCEANGWSERNLHVLFIEAQRCSHLAHTVPGLVVSKVRCEMGIVHT